MSASSPRVGVYVCHCGTNIAGTVDVEAVVRDAQTIPGVVVARSYPYVCSEPGQQLIKDDIAAHGLTRVVVASCSPRMHEPTFRAALVEAGLNAYCLEMANIREQVSWVHEDRAAATEKAQRLVRAAVAKAVRAVPLEEREAPVAPRALVIGGGIAGIQAALDVADAGFEALLVERQPSIGGHMAQLDKTFPTLDCAACILTPKMTDVARHPRIRLHAYTEVRDVQGYVGSFDAVLETRPRYVNWTTCNGCGDCALVCPVRVKNTFEAGLATRGAIYRQFPQAVPNKFVIEKKGVAPCRAACPAGVNAAGYVALTAAGRFARALDLERAANPLAAVCGYVCTRPCEHACVRRVRDEAIAIADLKRFLAEHESVPTAGAAHLGERERVAVIGAGPAGLACAWELARRGYRPVVFDAEPAAGGMLRAALPEWRLPVAALDADLAHIQSFGLEFHFGRRLGADLTLAGLEAEFPAVFLGLGASRPGRLGFAGEEHARPALLFLRDLRRGAASVGERVAVVGAGFPALDAARSARRRGAREVTLVIPGPRATLASLPAEIAAAEAEGIRFLLDTMPVRLTAAGTARRLELADRTGRPATVLEVDLVLTDADREPDLASLGSETGLVLDAAGRLMVDPLTLATERARVYAGGDLVRGPGSVVDAIAAGKRAAESIDRQLRGQDLRTGRDQPAARRAGPARLEPRQPRAVASGQPFTEEQARAEAARCLNCGVCVECLECSRVCAPGAIDHAETATTRTERVGAIVVATGYDEFNPTRKPELAYRTYPGVMTGLEFERLVAPSGPTGGRIEVNGMAPRDVILIHCVGSRDKALGNEYCSRVCCMATAKHAHLVREHLPEATVTVLYTDVRAFGKGFEEFYDRVRAEKVIYRRAAGAEIFRRAGRLVVRTEDTLLGQVLELPADLVVLAAGLEPRADTDRLATLLKLARSADRFFLEAHPKLKPVDTATAGIFLAGCCQAPKDIPDSVAQAKAAASAVLGLLAPGKVRLEPLSAVIDAERCSGCRVCADLCAYGALDFDELKKVMKVNEALCKGCGTCAAGCPSGAITMHQFTDEQIESQVAELT